MVKGEMWFWVLYRDETQQLRQYDAVLPLSLTLDFSGITFMDSSGIAVVLRAKKRMAALGGSVTLSGIPPQAGKVFEAAGIKRLITMI